AGQRDARELELRHVDRGADVPGEAIRYAGVEDPSVLTVMTAEAVLHLKALTSVERLREDLAVMPQIIRMNRFGPAISQLRLDRSTGEIEAGTIGIRVLLVGSCAPEHDGRGIQQQTEGLFIHAERPFRAPAFDQAPE